MSAQNWLFRTGFSLIAASGCIVSEPGITYVLPGKPDASTLPDGAGGSRSSAGGSAGAGQTDGRSGSDPGGAAGVGIDGIGGAGTAAGTGGVGGAGGAAGAFRDAGGASGDAHLDADARIDAGDAGDTGTGDPDGGSDGGTDTGDMDSGADGSTGTGGTGGNTGGTGGNTGGTGGTGGGNTSGTGAGGSSGTGGTGTGGTGGTGTITEFTIPTPNAGAYDIALGGDFNVWFTEETGNKIGRITKDGVITEYSIPSANAQPRGLTAAGGRIYFTEFAADKIGYLDTSNPSVITEVSSLAGPTGMVSATDGTVWYTAVGANEVVKLAAGGGTIAGHWPTPNGVGGVISFISTYDLWLGTTVQGTIDIIDPGTNVLSSLSFPDDGLGQPLSDIFIDWNSEIWFTDGAVLRHYDLTATFTAQSAPSSLRSLVAGPAGTAALKNLYITMPLANAILVRSSSTLTTQPVPTANATPHDIVNGADGNLWFTERTGNKIGRMVP